MRTRYIVVALLMSMVVVLITTSPATPETKQIPKEWPKDVALSGAYTGTGAYVTGAAICDAITKELGVPAQVMGGITTSQTVQLQEKRELIGGFQMSDTVYEGITGKGVFEGKPLKGLRILCVWDMLPWIFNSYPGSGVTTGADLKGKKFMVIKPGSRYGDDMGDGLLDAHGWTRNDVTLLPWAGIKEFSSGIRSRTVHAILWPWSPGSPHGEELARSVQLTYISLTEKETECMKKRGPYLVDKVYPPNSYSGQKEPMRVIIDPAFFGLGSWVPESLVYEICRMTMDDPKRFTKVHPNFGDFSFERSFMSAPPPAPYHPGVIKYLKEKRLWNTQLQTWQDAALAILQK